MSNKVLIPTTSADAHYSLVKDVVFARFINNKLDHAFKIGYGLVKRATAVSLDELTTPDETGSETGTGIFRISGSIVITQNSVAVMSGLAKNDGGRYGIHILYTDGSASSTPYINEHFFPAALSDDLVSRYPFVNGSFASDSSYKLGFGVRLSIKKESGGANRTATINLSGITMEDISWTPKNDADFYSRFSL